MSEPDNLLLEYMRRFDRRLTEMDTKIDRVLDDVHMLKVRMTAVEENLVGIQRRIDRVEERLERIERRVGLIDAAH
jgi:septation ring formation regulator EzrA